MAENCNASGKQCKIIVSEDESSRNTFLDDTDLRFEAEMAAAVFCPVPRGDSAATKRFYCAVASLCIPVVASDYFPFPFAETVDYASFVIRYRVGVAIRDRDRVRDRDKVRDRVRDYASFVIRYSEGDISP